MMTVMKDGQEGQPECAYPCTRAISCFLQATFGIELSIYLGYICSRNLGICAISRLHCAFSESRDCVPSASAAGSFCRSRMIFCPFSLNMVSLVWQPFSPYLLVQNFSKTFCCSLMDSITQLFQIAVCRLRMSSILRPTQ